jgi:hypothetical protein
VQLSRGTMFSDHELKWRARIAKRKAAKLAN